MHFPGVSGLKPQVTGPEKSMKVNRGSPRPADYSYRISEKKKADLKKKIVPLALTLKRRACKKLPMMRLLCFFYLRKKVLGAAVLGEAGKR